MEEKTLNSRKKYKLKKYAEKYNTHERLLIASATRKTIRYIERNTSNFPNKYLILINVVMELNGKNLLLILDYINLL